MAKKERLENRKAFTEAQRQIRLGLATIETCGYKPRTYFERQLLEAITKNRKRALAKRRENPAPRREITYSQPNYSLRELMALAADHPSGGIPIGRNGWPPANDMVRRAVRQGYATLERESRPFSRFCRMTRLLPTEKGRAYAARG